MDNFLALMRQFIANEITPDEFEVQYIDLWREYREYKFPQKQREVINTLFTDVDCYDPNAKPGTPFTITAKELYKAVEAAYTALTQ